MKAGNNHKLMILADQGIVSGTAVLSQMLIAFCLGVATYGRFSILVLVQLFLLSVQQAGLTGIFQVKYKDGALPEQRLLNGIWAIELFWLLILAVLGWAIYPFFSYGCSAGEWLMVIINVTGFLLQDYFRRVFIGRQQYRQLLVIDSVNNGLQLSGLLLLLLIKEAQLWMVLLVCGASFIPALLWVVWRFAPRPVMQYAGSFLQHYGKEASWMIAAALLQWLAGNFYMVAAGWWLGMVALGMLRLGQYLFGLFHVLFQAAENYILPKAGVLQRDIDEMLRYLRNVQTKIVLAATGLLLLVALVSRPVTELLYKEQAEALSPVIYGLCGTYLLIATGYPVRIGLRLLGLSHTFFSGYVLTAVFGVSTAYSFIHWWGIGGVIAGLLLSQALLLIYWIAVLQRKYAVLWK